MKNSKKHNMYFLATTALEDFWNVEMPILFLGEWCQKSKRRPFWEQLNYTVVSSSWDKKEQVYEARQYTKDLFNNAINFLSERFNRIHNENHSAMYWKIVLGPWLRWYINVVYTRYVNLRDIIDNYEYFTTTLLPKENHITPIDTLNFRNLTHIDEFNLQIYSRIFESLGMNYPTKSIENEKRIIYEADNNVSSVSYKKVLIKTVVGLLHKFQNKGSIFLATSYFDNAEVLKFFVGTVGKVFPIIGKMPVQISPVKLCEEKRAHLRAIEFENTEFEIVLNELLPLDVPICYVEGYETAKQYVKSNYPRKPSVIFSANDWYFNENIKLWAASSKEFGTTLIGTQHGGNYGSIAYPHEAEFETDITDRYYTWGWEKKNCNAEVIPFYGTKLSGRKIIGADNSKQDILFTATKIFWYPLYIERYPLLVKNYFFWQEIFISKININIRPFFRIRLHREDPDNEMNIRWTSFAPGLHLEKPDKPFISSLTNCRLFICDHLSTTFAEALSANKPSILFWHPERYDLIDDAIPYYEMLKNAGILYHTPEEAAEKVNFVYQDVETWWNGSEVQEAVKIFTERFARTSKNSHKMWLKEFEMIIKQV